MFVVQRHVESTAFTTPTTTMTMSTTTTMPNDNNGNDDDRFELQRREIVSGQPFWPVFDAKTLKIASYARHIAWKLNRHHFVVTLAKLIISGWNLDNLLHLKAHFAYLRAMALVCTTIWIISINQCVWIPGKTCTSTNNNSSSSGGGTRWKRRERQTHTHTWICTHWLNKNALKPKQVTWMEHVRTLRNNGVKIEIHFEMLR